MFNLAAIQKIITLNKIINNAIVDRDFSRAAKFMLKLHKFEHKEGAPIGSYRLRSEL